jgi:hypothetical protein
MWWWFVPLFFCLSVLDIMVKLTGASATSPFAAQSPCSAAPALSDAQGRSIDPDAMKLSQD